MNNKLYFKCAYNKNIELYSFTIDDNESDPDAKIIYGNDNIDYEPAYMDYDKGEFNYGSWADAFFMKFRPCMLKYDGTVDYYLDPNDYTKKEDGTLSDIANTSYGGNAMIEFPKTYIKRDVTSNTTYICNQKLNDDYKCWSHLDNNGNEIDFCYMPIYDGSVINNKLRSISGQNVTAYQSVQAEINYAKANNLNSDIIWYTWVMCDYVLIRDLSMLISKSTNSQKKFGNSGSSSNTVYPTGTLNNKGLFYGKNDSSSGVKVFGMENLWGNIFKRIAGYVYDHNTQKIKMTYGTSDGSTVEGYNLDGNGYIAIPDSTLSGTSGEYTDNNEFGYISGVKFTEFGIIPLTLNGSSTTYYCDVVKYNNNKNNYVGFGGDILDKMNSGIFSLYLDHGYSSDISWDQSTSVSCKPLANTN